jgi:site-specific DNA-adenine methylase
MLAGMGYPGGKAAAGVYQKIINLMPPHSLYVEPFLGGGAIMQRKRSAPRSIGLDLDPHVIAAWEPLPHVAVQLGDALDFLSTFQFPHDALIYCDPPYLLETRRSGPLYRCEITTAQHEHLLALITRLPCQVMISGYWSQLYAEALQEWPALSFEAMTRGGTTATEWLWCNFLPPHSLHDYQYLGRDFRERERIKRKTQRWKARLLRMPALERQALMTALAEVSADPLARSGEGGSARSQ